MFEQTEGVTEAAVVETPAVSAQDSAPESNGDAPQTTEEKSLADNNKEFNFNKMRESMKRLENEKRLWMEERKRLEGAAQLDQNLRKDPRTGLKFLAQSLGVDLKTLIEELNPNTASKSELPQIDFDQYDPETAKLLKFMHERASKVDQLEQWKNQFEQTNSQREQQAQIQQAERNMEAIDSEFDNQLIKDGYMDKDGNGDQSVIRLIQKSVLAELAEHGDPRLATREQFQEAYKQVLAGLSAHKNQTLKKTITTNVPATGSRQGQATVAKGPLTKDQRIAMMADVSKGAFGE